jgi:hypothetical protein
MGRIVDILTLGCVREHLGVTTVMHMHATNVCWKKIDLTLALAEGRVLAALVGVGGLR